MKKSAFLILIIIIAFLFCSCITKDDVKDKDDELENLEEDYEELEEEYDALSESLEQLYAELAEIESANTSLSAQNEAAKTENEELTAQIPKVFFQFSEEQYYDQMEIVSEEENICGVYISYLGDIYLADSLPNDLYEVTYELEGDAETDSYLTLTFIIGEEYDEVYEITAAYSSEEYEAEYSNLVDLITASLILIMDDPYDYDSEIMDIAKDALEDGSYYYEYITVCQESTGDTGITRLFCEN